MSEIRYEWRPEAGEILDAWHADHSPRPNPLLAKPTKPVRETVMRIVVKDDALEQIERATRCNDSATDS